MKTSATQFECFPSSTENLFTVCAVRVAVYIRPHIHVENFLAGCPPKICGSE